MGDTTGVQALRALHDVTKEVHASLDLKSTLDAVTRGVAAATEFQVACLNLLMGDGFLEIVSVAGPADAREALLGMREAETGIRHVMDTAQHWGSLRFIDHRIELHDYIDNWWIPDTDPAAGSPTNPGTQADAGPNLTGAEPGGESGAGFGADSEHDTGAWHPEDVLCALLTTPDGEWLGLLSVDLPASGRKPNTLTRQILEIFADHAAIAIMHARMHDQVVASEARLEYAATHDALTGLGNRALIAGLETLPASPQEPAAVITIDLNDFKAVNDTHGHAAGDEVLQIVAQRLHGCVRDGDIVARTGGDEFVILLRGPHVPRLLPDLEARLATAINAPIAGVTGTHHVGASIGTAYTDTPTTLSRLTADADAAMYDRKRAHHSQRQSTGRETAPAS